MVAISAEAG